MNNPRKTNPRKFCPRKVTARKINRFVGAMVLCCAAVTTAQAKEIYSNGFGGGAWDVASTWRGNVVPGSDDIAVVSRDDEVTFARDDSETITCAELHIDPGGALRFQSRVGRVVARIAGKVRSHGTIQIDATRARTDYMAIHLLAPEHENRKIEIREGGSITAVGRSDLGKGKYNVVIVADLPEGAEGTTSGQLAIGDGCSLDLRQTHFDNVEVLASNIDNTGAEFNERLTIDGNYFTREARLGLAYCDTAIVTNNTFEKPDANWVQPGAITLRSCPLSELRGNVVKGWYYHGIHGYGSSDVSILENTIESTYIGIYWYGSNAMIQRLLLRKVKTGVQFNYGNGAIDGMVSDEVYQALYVSRGYAQVSNWEDRNSPKTNRSVYLSRGYAVLINTNVSAEQVELHKDAALLDEEADHPLVKCMQYVVVGVDGNVPPGSLVQMQTVGWKPPLPGATDLNVRNSPAPLSNSGLTPRPATMRPLIVQSWLYGEDHKLVPPPKYDLRIVKPEGDALKTLKAIQVTPTDDWFRPDPNAPKPTVEVKF